MTIALATVVGLLSAPELVALDLRYPESELRREASGAAMIELVVDQNGLPVLCETLETYEDERLGKNICDMMGGTRFKPARDAEGKIAVGKARLLMKMMVEGTNQGLCVERLSTGDDTIEVKAARIGSRKKPIRTVAEPLKVSKPFVTFEVPSLPSEIGQFLDVQIVAAFDQSGQVTSCAAAPILDGQNNRARYSAAACDQLENMDLGASLELNGSPVDYVQRLDVRFVVSNTAET